MLRQYDGWCELNMNAPGEDVFDDVNVAKGVMAVNI
jgi:hypothetical protein